MKITSLILGSVLVCSALAYDLESRRYDDNSLGEAEDVEKAMLPGVCWGCKWILNKIKKTTSNGTTQEEFKEKLLAVCDIIGFLKSTCKAFVEKKLEVLVEELSTTDDVRTICVNVKACKPKELLNM